MNTIPLAEARGLEALARRTSLVRGLLAALLVGLVLAAAASARGPHVSAGPVAPAASGSVIVLDLSASISSDTYSRLGGVLRSLASSSGRYGLVVFSNVAYEALPPGTPAAALEPLVRYFTLPRQRAPGRGPVFPVNPWSASFSNGTRISAGLDLARSLAARRSQVVLVSDLADDPQDLQRLTASLLAYRQAGVPLRVVALNASADDAAKFEDMLGSASVVAPGPPAGRRVTSPRARFPVSLALAIVAVAFVLAAFELWLARLRWDDTSQVPA